MSLAYRQNEHFYNIDFKDAFFLPFNIDDARDEIIERFRAVSGQENYAPLINDDIMILTDCFLEYLKEQQERLVYIALKNYLRYATGEFLDQLVALIGIERKQQAPATATVKITAKNPAFLPKGTALSDGEGHYAYITKDTYIEESAAAHIEAELSAPPSAKFEALAVPNIYITKIEQADALEQKSHVETDDELRRRFMLALHRFSTAGSKESYKFWVQSVVGVERCAIYDDRARPGEVDIYILSELEDINDKVADALEPHRPLTDKLNFLKATVVEQDLKIYISVKDKHLLSEVIEQIDAEVSKFYELLQLDDVVDESKIITLCKHEQITHAELGNRLVAPKKGQLIKLKNLSIDLLENKK